MLVGFQCLQIFLNTTNYSVRKTHISHACILHEWNPDRLANGWNAGESNKLKDQDRPSLSFEAVEFLKDRSSGFVKQISRSSKYGSPYSVLRFSRLTCDLFRFVYFEARVRSCSFLCVLGRFATKEMDGTGKQTEKDTFERHILSLWGGSK